MTLEHLDKQKKEVLLKAAELSETKVKAGATNAEIVEALNANDVDDEHFTWFLLPEINKDVEDQAHDKENTDVGGESVTAEEKAVTEPAKPAVRESKIVEHDDTVVAPKGVVTSASLSGAAEEEDDEEPAEFDEDADEYLVKYLGGSPHREHKGYLFRKTHPFVVVKKEHVEKILKNDQFRLASPKELEDFYS